MPRELDHGAEMTFDEIAKELGIKRQTVCNTYLKALRKLKRELEKRRLTLADLLENIR